MGEQDEIINLKPKPMIYHAILFSYANTKQQDKLLKVVEDMLSDKIQLDIVCWNIVNECLGLEESNRLQSKFSVSKEQAFDNSAKQFQKIN